MRRSENIGYGTCNCKHPVLAADGSCSATVKVPEPIDYKAWTLVHDIAEGRYKISQTLRSRAIALQREAAAEDGSYT